MNPEMRHEQVIYQNPFLAIRIWQIDSVVRESSRRQIDEWVKMRKGNWRMWHYHKEVEFLLVLKGEVTVLCKDERFSLRKGDVAVFGSSEPHTTLQSKTGNTSQVVFQIDLRKYWDSSTLGSMRHFSEVLRPLSEMNYVYRDNAEVRTRTVAHIMDIFREMNGKKLGYELAVSSLIKQMLLLLLRHDDRKLLGYNDDRLLERLQPAVDFVEERLGDKLSVTELSDRMNMSYTHFIKTFKRAFGMSFTEFVVYKRIRKAEQQLLASELSIAEVAESVGISNLGHFYKLFRRYNGCSPKEFKNSRRESFPSLEGETGAGF